MSHFNDFIKRKWVIPAFTFVVGSVVTGVTAAATADYTKFKDNVKAIAGDLHAVWDWAALNWVVLFFAGALVVALILLAREKRRFITAGSIPLKQAVIATLEVASVDAQGFTADVAVHNRSLFRAVEIYVSKCRGVYSCTKAREGSVEGLDRVRLPPGGRHSFRFRGGIDYTERQKGQEKIDFLFHVECALEGRYDSEALLEVLGDRETLTSRQFRHTVYFPRTLPDQASSS